MGNGGGVLPSSSNPDPISDQTMSFFTLVFRQVWPLRNYFVITFFLKSFGIATINMSYIPVIPSKTIPDSRPKGAKSKPVFLHAACLWTTE